MPCCEDLFGAISLLMESRVASSPHSSRHWTINRTACALYRAAGCPYPNEFSMECELLYFTQFPVIQLHAALMSSKVEYCKEGLMVLPAATKASFV